MRTCLHCSGDISPRLRVAVYCNRACYIAARIERRRATCSTCGEEFVKKKARGQPRRSYCPNCRRSVERNCQQCGATFRRWASQVRMGGGVFCSVDCKTASQRFPWDQLDRSALKNRWTKEGRPLICARCGHDHPWNIQIHHKHYRRDGGGNDPSNLEPLCRNCHGDEHYAGKTADCSVVDTSPVTIAWEIDR